MFMLNGKAAHLLIQILVSGATGVSIYFRELTANRLTPWVWTTEHQIERFCFQDYNFGQQLSYMPGFDFAVAAFRLGTRILPFRLYPP